MMDFKEFETKIKDINKELFEIKNSDNLGTPTYANLLENQQSVLIIGLNPNTTKKNQKKKEDRKTVYPLIYVPDQEGSDLWKFFKDNSYVWDYKKAYGLVGDKAKMFWTTDDAYLTEISNAYPKHREEWKECYETEKQKNKSLILAFADLFYIDEGTQTNVRDYLKNDRKSKLKSVDGIIRLYIEFYKPKLIIVTNADASDYIYESQYHKARDRKITKEMILNHKEKDTKILFSSALHPAYATSNEDYYKLKQRINELL